MVAPSDAVFSSFEDKLCRQAGPASPPSAQLCSPGSYPSPPRVLSSQGSQRRPWVLAAARGGSGLCSDLQAVPLIRSRCGLLGPDSAALRITWEPACSGPLRPWRGGFGLLRSTPVHNVPTPQSPVQRAARARPRVPGTPGPSQATQEVRLLARLQHWVGRTPEGPLQGPEPGQE